MEQWNKHQPCHRKTASQPLTAIRCTLCGPAGLRQDFKLSLWVQTTACVDHNDIFGRLLSEQLSGHFAVFQSLPFLLRSMTSTTAYLILLAVSLCRKKRPRRFLERSTTLTKKRNGFGWSILTDKNFGCVPKYLVCISIFENTTNIYCHYWPQLGQGREYLQTMIFVYTGIAQKTF